MSLKKIIILFSLVFSCALIIPTVHFAFNKEFKISGSTHVFLMNHLIETGILDDYLEENCSNHNFKLCGYRDQLGWNFIWSADSPLQKTGGWTANKSEYSFIIKEILTTPKYLILLFHKSIEYTLKQFFTFNVSISGPQLKPSPPYDQISWRFEDTKMEYLSSLQNQSKLNVDFVNILEQIFVMLSIVFLIVTLITPTLSDKLEHNLKWTIILIMIYDFLNSFVCANLSTVDERFQNRLIWLFPMLAIIVMMKFVEKKVKIVL